jgi:hypothetical protein
MPPASTDGHHAHRAVPELALFGLQLRAIPRAVLAHATDDVRALVATAHAAKHLWQIFGSHAALEQLITQELFPGEPGDLQQALIHVEHDAIDVKHQALE